MKKYNKVNIYLVFGFLVFYSLLISFYYFDLFKRDFYNEKNINSYLKVKKNEVIKIDRNFYNSSLILKDYSEVDFKITENGKKIINNIRQLHKTPNLVSVTHANKDVCAGFIWLLSEKIWGNAIPYYIGMLNQSSKTPAKSWELPNYYISFGGKNLIDLGDKFSLEKLDYWEKITNEDIKLFFSKAFSEEGLLGDIGFLYKKSKYLGFLEGRSRNSHVTKNMGVSDFEITIQKNYEDTSHLDIISDSFGCSKDMGKDYYEILNYYNLSLNGKKIIFYNGELYYLNSNNTLGKKINLKYLDKISYKDITLVHYFEKGAKVDSLFNLICKGDLFPINITSINPRFIEKM